MARPPLTARGQWLRILVALPALVAIFALGEAVLDRHAWRIDLTPEQRYTLSPHARQVLGQLDRDVRVVAFLRSQDPRNPLIEDLLRQVRAAGGQHVTVQTLDVNRSPAAAREYGVDSYGALVVESDGQRRVFANPGEDVLVSAVLEVTRREKRVIGWSAGHGEGDTTALDRRTGFSGARQALLDNHFDVRPIALMREAIPADVDVFAIVGPAKDFLPDELQALRQFLDSGRGLLVCLDPLRAPVLAEWLREYGVVTAPDVVVEPAARLYGGEQLTLKVELDRGGNPLLAAMGAGPLFSRSRSVAMAPGAPGTVLLWTSKQGWATTDTATAFTNEPVFDPLHDRRGPISLGVETFTSHPDGAGGTGRAAHVIVFGNAEFAGNFFLDFLGNRDLLVNSVRWLARDRESVGEGMQRRTAGVQQFFLSEEDGAWAFWMTAVVEPGIFLVIGLVLVARRRWG